MLFICLTAFAFAQLTDSAVHAPPTAGTYHYNNFKPGAAGFPAVGSSYTDPVFGTAIKRLTARTGEGDDQIYARHVANANGTYAFENAGGNKVINPMTGAVIWSGNQVPTGSVAYEIHWDAIDPDKYYYFSGANLMRRNLTAQTNTTMKTFASTLQDNGGSLNLQSADGRYFTVRYGGTNKLWDSQTDTIYTGAVTPLDSNGWVTITPDGNYLVTAAGGSAQPQKEHYSYAINHTTKAISSTPNQFWGLAGDHGVVTSATDGKNYYVSFSTHSVNPGIYRVDITLNQAGRTEAQQQSSNRMLVALDWADTDGHFSAISKGPYRDWVFHASENYANDNYNSVPSGWTAYKQEIIAMNVVTGEVRRFAHHRSRGLNDYSYWNSPRVSTSWDGSLVVWDSNFNISSPFGYADLYAINNPFGAVTPPPPDTTAPTVSITAPVATATLSGTATVTANASDNVGVVGVRLLVDDVVVGAEDTMSPFAFSLDTTGLANGAHTLKVRARDLAGNVTSTAALAVTVSNVTTPPPPPPDTTLPTVTVTAPMASATVSGTINLSATAADNVGVVGVQFFVDGVLAGDDTSSPYSISFNTLSLSNGAHAVTARARDLAGNMTTSAAVAFSINNVVTPPPVLVTLTMDNLKPGKSNLGVSFTGSWCRSTESNFFGTRSIYSCGGSKETYRFTPTIIAAGNYDVYVRYTSNAQRASTVNIDVISQDPVSHKQVNQRNNGSTWVLLGTYRFAVGTIGYVEFIEVNSGDRISVDGLMLKQK